MIGFNASTTKASPWSPRDRRTTGLIAAVLLAAALLSICILGSRNLFDDEASSLPFVTGSVTDNIAVAQQGDVHPPGMYLLAHFAWCVVPSLRWMNLVPMSVLFAGLAVFLVSFLPTLPSRIAASAGLVFAALHPELLMWSNTFRWYCPWTGLALLALVLFLQPRRDQWRLNWAEALAGGLLLALMFYLNYLTLLFVLALAAAVWISSRGTADRRSCSMAALAAFIFVALIAPQWHAFFAVHLPNSGAQRSSVLLSTMRLLQASSSSEAFLPWDPLALAAGLGSIAVLGCGLVALYSSKRASQQQAVNTLQLSSQRSLALFGFLFLLLVALTGLGGKPRSAILLVPVFAPAFAIGVAGLRRQYQAAVVALLLAWSSVGAAHLLGRSGLQKSSMNERPEQVATLIARDLRGSNNPKLGESCGIAATANTGVALTLAQARIPRLMILSSDRGSIFAGTLSDLPAGCERPHLYIVRSYMSGEPDRDPTYVAELQAAQLLLHSPATVSLSPDPDAPAKRTLSRWVGLNTGAGLPDYRFVVLSGEIERAQVPKLRRTLHFFVSGDGIVPDWTQDQAAAGELANTQQSPGKHGNTRIVRRRS